MQLINTTNQQINTMHSQKRVVRISEPSPKILFMGEARVGKTALIDKLQSGSLSSSSLPGSRFHKYVPTSNLNICHVNKNNTDQKYTIWDCTSNRKSTLNDRHIRGATHAILVCNLLIPFTQKQLWYWRDKIITASPGAKLTVVANVSNVGRDLRDEYLLQFLHEFPDIGIHVTNIRTATQTDILQIIEAM